MSVASVPTRTFTERTARPEERARRKQACPALARVTVIRCGVLLAMLRGRGHHRQPRAPRRIASIGRSPAAWIGTFSLTALSPRFSSAHRLGVSVVGEATVSSALETTQHAIVESTSLHTTVSVTGEQRGGARTREVVVGGAKDSGDRAPGTFLLLGLLRELRACQEL